MIRIEGYAIGDHGYTGQRSRVRYALANGETRSGCILVSVLWEHFLRGEGFSRDREQTRATSSVIQPRFFFPFRAQEGRLSARLRRRERTVPS